MGSLKDQMIDDQNEAFERKLARFLGISQNEFYLYPPTYHDSEHGDGYYEFPNDLTEEIKDKIREIDSHNRVYITSSELEEVSDSTDPGVDNYTGPEDLRSHPTIPGLE